MMVTMFGILLMALATTFGEVGESIGKWEMRSKLETPFAYGVLNNTFIVLALGVTALLRWDTLHFDPASIPLLLIRLPLEIALVVCFVYAVKYADRSTFGFLRTLTIPLLLVVDMVLGYLLDPFQIVGMLLIVAALFFLFINHGFSRKGVWFTLGASVFGVATASLYKFSVTHYNSPEIEQGIMFAALLIFLIVMGFVHEKKNPFRLFRYPVCLVQGILVGIGGSLASLSFLWAAPSVLMAVKRAGGLLAAIVSGGAVFREKKLTLKLSVALMTAAGVVLLVF